MPLVKRPDEPVKEKAEAPVKRPPTVTIRRPLPTTNEKLVAFVTALLNTYRLYYIRMYPDSLEYEYEAPASVGETLKWFLDKRKK